MKFIELENGWVNVDHIVAITPQTHKHLNDPDSDTTTVVALSNGQTIEDSRGPKVIFNLIKSAVAI
jgi:hypothetical protein